MRKKNLKNKITIENYSNQNSIDYENVTNKNFLYGKATKEFVKKIKINKNDTTIADLGCGTGFVYEILSRKYKNKKLKFYGIDPAKGMLKIAKKKIKDKRIKFIEGSFEKIPLKNNSVDKIVSTFALHWVSSIEDSIKEIKRILKPNGTIDILMIDKNDGKEFKKPIYKIMQEHLSFKQIINAANLIQRITKKDLINMFSKYFNLHKDYKLSIINKRELIYGSCEDHLNWWKARSLQIISEIKNKKNFINDLKNELNKLKTKKGVGFDLSLLNIHLINK